MRNFDYEKKNAITSLKNEKYGLEQLIKDLEKLRNFDFSKVDGKIINARVENALKEAIDGYLKLIIGYDNENKISIIIKERYNQETKCYVQFYDSYKFTIGYNKTLKDGIHEQRRFDTFKTLENIDIEITHLKKQLARIENDLSNIDKIIDDLKNVYESVQNFKKDKTGFLLDCFRDLNGFY